MPFAISETRNCADRTQQVSFNHWSPKATFLLVLYPMKEVPGSATRILSIRARTSCRRARHITRTAAAGASGRGQDPRRGQPNVRRRSRQDLNQPSPAQSPRAPQRLQWVLIPLPRAPWLLSGDTRLYHPSHTPTDADFAICLPMQDSQCQQAEEDINTSTYRPYVMRPLVRTTPTSFPHHATWDALCMRVLVVCVHPGNENVHTLYCCDPAKTLATRDQPTQRANVSLHFGRVRETSRVRPYAARAHGCGLDV